MTLNIIFMTDFFFLSFLIEEERFKENYLNNLNIDNEPYVMCSLYYEDNNNNKIYITDNETWIFGKFYKWLKNKNWKN